jgi:hypothetical protein
VTKNERPFQFSLLLLLLGVTAFAIACSSWKTSPLLGMFATLLLLYGSLAIWAECEEAAHRSELLTIRNKCRVFIEAAATVIIATIGVFIAGSVINFWFLNFVFTTAPSGQ